MKNGFVLYPTPAVGARPDEDELQHSLLEMEQRLFGLARLNSAPQSDADFVPVKT